MEKQQSIVISPVLLRCVCRFKYDDAFCHQSPSDRKLELRLCTAYFEHLTFITHLPLEVVDCDL